MLFISSRRAHTRRADVTTPCVSFDRRVVKQSIHQCFENRVRVHADRIAIQTNERRPRVGLERIALNA